MSEVAENLEMSRPKGRPRSERDDVSVKIDRAVAAKAKHIAAHEGVPGGVAELLTGILKTPIDKRYAKMLRELEETPDDG